MSTVAQFLRLLAQNGSDAVFHRDQGASLCPCRTPEGFRDPVWHLQHPLEPVCNEAGFVIDPDLVTNLSVKAFIQPIQSTRATRLSTEILLQMFGSIEADDHLGIFPLAWSSVPLTFDDWSVSGEDWIEYLNNRYTVINVNMIPDPVGGLPHHTEVGLRLINSEAL